MRGVQFVLYEGPIFLFQNVSRLPQKSLRRKFSPLPALIGLFHSPKPAELILTDQNHKDNAYSKIIKKCKIIRIMKS